MSDPLPAISLHQVEKTYRIYRRPSDRLKQSLVRGRKHYFTEHKALHPLTLDIPKGQTVGVIGVNGSGKSTLLQLITRTLTPTGGSLSVRGRVSALLELGAGFNPEFTGRENIFLNASIMGMSREEIAERYDGIMEFSGLAPHLLEQPVSTYSSGMYVRLAFAVAIAVNPDILIVDEALAVGDEGFQRKCFARIQELQQAGATILFVSHSARTIIDLCNHALLLDAGELLMQGAPAQVVAAYHHMLFAQEEERPAIRTRIQEGTIDDPDASEISATDNIFNVPETYRAYPPDGGVISNITLVDEAGKETRRLQSGQTYQLRYNLTTDQPLNHVRCTMMMKTMTGIELAGAMYQGDAHDFDHIQAGTSIELCFRFTCTLTKGDYFINVGAVEETFGTYRFIHRIVDALHIKVEDSAHTEDETMRPRGWMDMGITCSSVPSPMYS